jgi:hypothetical protein
MEKGLFSGLFLMIMLMLLTPTIIVSDQSPYIKDTYNHLNLLTLSADNVVADALLEVTIENCSLGNVAQYNIKVNEFLSLLRNELNNTNIFCTTLISNINLNGNDYSGNITLKCTQSNLFTNIVIEKKLKFSKDITFVNNPPDCTVTIKDNLDNSKVYAIDTR